MTDESFLEIQTQAEKFTKNKRKLVVEKQLTKIDTITEVDKSDEENKDETVDKRRNNN